MLDLIPGLRKIGALIAIALMITGGLYYVNTIRTGMTWASGTD